MKLAEFAHGRDNNFNLIRMVAAYAVLVSHGFVLVTGSSAAEPLRNTLGMSIGEIAVDIFFITSGFLVSASLLTRQSTSAFAWARMLRVFPALSVMLLLTIIGLGPFFTTSPLPSYFTDSQTYKYFMKGMTLITGVAFGLPGVFANNPYPNAVNGSLWTMVYEVRMYLLLAVIWACSRLTTHDRLKSFKIAIVSIAIISCILSLLVNLELIKHSKSLRLFFMFFCGSSFFILRDRITISHSMFVTILAALLLATFNQHLFFAVYLATLACLLLYLAYIPSGCIRKYNRLGDYSYGVYIYAFPIQQSIAALLPGISVFSLVILSASITSLFAGLSWHLLEKHALRLKGRLHNQSPVSPAAMPGTNQAVMARIPEQS